MLKKITDVKLKPMTKRDLELVMAWRSHPQAYTFFQQQNGPLVWSEHFQFWSSRKNRKDFIISFFENNWWRKVGNLNLTALNTELPEIGIIVGELTAHGKGIGTKAIRLALRHLQNLGHTQAGAVIHCDNIASQKIFEKCNFTELSKQNNLPWKRYILEKIII